MNTIKFLLAGTAVFLSLTNVANAGVMNGGFELPAAPVAGYTEHRGGSSFTGWNVVGNDVDLVNSSYTEGALTFNANSGGQSLDLTGGGNSGFTNGVTQNVTTVVGQLYSLSFYVGRLSGNANYATPTTVGLSFDGGVVRELFTHSDVTANRVNWK